MNESRSIRADDVALAASAGAGGAVAVGGPGPLFIDEPELAPKALGQWAHARRRFLRHRLAVGSLVVLLVILGMGAFADTVAPYSYDEIDLANAGVGPTLEGKHFFGTDLLGRDYFSRVVWGIQTSEKVAFLVAFLSTLIGTIVGAFAGYYGRWVDNLLMRFTDLVLALPGLAVLLTAAAFLGNGSKYRTAAILALLFWTSLARIVRGIFLSQRETGYVEAARAAGAGDFRIMFRHMLPNAVGAITVNATLVIGVAILTEAALSFLGFGIQPPTPALGKLISDGQDGGTDLWWLVAFPGMTIVLIVLCINFIGDGLRDALDPTQRRTA
jgi:ABC-type dipeptide/oligopeptide/nickel transport system permease subunit